MFARAPATRRQPSLAIPRACQAACSSTTRRSSFRPSLRARTCTPPAAPGGCANGLRLGGALGLERLLGLAQPLAPIAAGAQPLGQLITTLSAVELVLGPVRSGGLLENPRGDVLVAALCVMGRRRRDLGAVDGDNPTLTSPARAHSSSTPPNSPAIARSYCARKRAIAA